MSERQTSRIRAINKLHELKPLQKIIEKHKKDGLRVVLCHGVFDLLHFGHVKHLQAAGREGDVVVVTITSDKFVNKGPNRPIFPEQVRAEMLASLEIVDYVAINHNQTALEPISMLRPNVYFKGNEYVNSKDDISGNIALETEQVKKIGGRIVFTDEITFSSSKLINEHLNVYESDVREYLEGKRDSKFLNDLIHALELIQNKRILFIGDAIIDEYRYVVPMGRSAKENMIATLYQDKEIFAGGVFAAANHLADFCSDVEIITSFGDHDSYESFVRESLKPNVKLQAVYRHNAPTTRKTRYIDTGYSMRKLFEVYSMEDRPLSEGREAELLSLIASKLDKVDIVIVTDFGHGLLTQKVIDLVQNRSPFLAVNAQSNSANYGFNLITKYKRADYICIDGPEARLAVHEKYASLSDIIQNKLPDLIDVDKRVITQGKNGCIVSDQNCELKSVPALTSTIVDTVGAGDAFFALTAPLVSTGVSMEQVGFLGNAAGAMKVGIVGHRHSISRASLIKFMTAILK